jgi:hypothetical protein
MATRPAWLREELLRMPHAPRQRRAAIDSVRRRLLAAADHPPNLKAAEAAGRRAARVGERRDIHLAATFNRVADRSVRACHDRVEDRQGQRNSGRRCVTKALSEVSNAQAWRDVGGAVANFERHARLGGVGGEGEGQRGGGRVLDMTDRS